MPARVRKAERPPSPARGPGPFQSVAPLPELRACLHGAVAKGL
jgi:hypothetical protein